MAKLRLAVNDNVLFSIQVHFSVFLHFVGYVVLTSVGKIQCLGIRWIDYQVQCTQRANPLSIRLLQLDP